MIVRAKFRVEKIVTHKMWAGFARGAVETHEVVGCVVTGGCPENDKFFESTPYGGFTLGLIASDLAFRFKPGTEIAVNFNLPDEDAKPQG